MANTVFHETSVTKSVGGSFHERPLCSGSYPHKNTKCSLRQRVKNVHALHTADEITTSPPKTQRHFGVYFLQLLIQLLMHLRDLMHPLKIS